MRVVSLLLVALVFISTCQTILACPSTALVKGRQKKAAAARAAAPPRRLAGPLRV